jgi:hypothetical protein
VSKLGDTVVSRANTTYAGVAAEDAVLQKAGQVTHTRVFVVGARLFEAIDITASLDVARPNYDRVISSFALQ